MHDECHLRNPIRLERGKKGCCGPAELFQHPCICNSALYVGQKHEGQSLLARPPQSLAMRHISTHSSSIMKNRGGLAGSWYTTKPILSSRSMFSCSHRLQGGSGGRRPGNRAPAFRPDSQDQYKHPTKLILCIASFMTVPHTMKMCAF